MLKEGDKAPAFSAVDQDGAPVGSASLEGKPYIVYFYPKDNTPGCTKEACSFRDAYAEYRKKGVAVFGVSADSVASHRKFADKFQLPFTLLSDPDKALLKAFGAWGEKKLYGKVYEGIIRSTFVVGADGLIKKVFPKVSPADHAEEVLGVL